MNAISLGEIARRAGYSRARIHSFAVANRIPGRPLKRPPQGQYRYEETPELKDWIENLKAGKESNVGKPRRWKSKSETSRARAALIELDSIVRSRRYNQEDIANAHRLLDACKHIIEGGLMDEDRPCTRATLTFLSVLFKRKDDTFTSAMVRSIWHYRVRDVLDGRGMNWSN